MQQKEIYPETIYKLGIALSGGGARGFAHLGVIKALQEIHVVPEIISGTSAGAIAGMLIAAGKTPDECLDFFLDKSMMRLVRFTISKKGIMTFGDIGKALEDFIGIKTFEELKTPLVATATDIEYGKHVQFRSGKLIPRILASSSIPIVFVPIVIDGKMYVDGGVFMNLPVRPIRKLCEKVIAVDINLFECNTKVKNMLHMAERSFHLGLASNTKIDRNISDYIISPQNMERFSLFDIKRAREIFEAGYLEAQSRTNDLIAEISHTTVND